MQRFEVYYYDVPLATIWAADRVNAVRQMGARFGGQVGVRLA
jgi:hypothetical protein